ncbi:MAG: hypothetical protein WCS86_00045 [Candidatus Paceibacterota bacterium]
MKFEFIVKLLNKKLEKGNPKIINPSWILKNTPNVYSYIQKNIRTENNDIDWDKVTTSFNRSFQKRWTKYRCKQIEFYESQSEVDTILSKYKDKLYTFLCVSNTKDKHIQQTMLVSLVRIGQKGNICAQNEVVKWITYITDDWIDRYPQMYRWKGYTDEIEYKIKGCIRCYRYTGSFLGYLFRTLEYSARGKPPLVSLNDHLFESSKNLEEYAIVQEDWQIYK